MIARLLSFLLAIVLASGAIAEDQLALFIPQFGVPGTTAPIPDGFWPLQSTLVPSWSAGSGTPTFTRATAKTQIDFEGLYHQALSGEAVFQGARRVFNGLGINGSKSEDLTGTGWNTNNATVIDYQTANSDVAKAQLRIIPTGATSGPNHVIVTRFEARSDISNFRLSVVMNDTVAWGTYSASVLLTLTSTWTIYSIKFTANAAAGTGVNFIFGDVDDGGDSAGATHGDAPAGTYQLRRVQYVDVTGAANQNPPEYVSVGVLSAPWHGAGVDGIQYFTTLNGNTVSSNVVTEAVGAVINSSAAAAAKGVTAGVVDANGPTGYLVENATTNLALWSRNMTNAAWVAVGITTAQTATGADGVANSATTVTAGGAVTNTILQTVTEASASMTYSALIRRKTGTGTIKLTQDGGVTLSSDISSSLNTSTYTLVQWNASVLNPAFGIVMGTQNDVIEVDGNQFEAGTIASSRKFTTTVAVTGNADVLTYPLASNILGTAGTVSADVTTEWAGTSTLRADVVSSATGSPLYVESSAGKLSINDGAAQLGNVLTGSATVQKIASTWGGSAGATYIAGVASSALSFDGDLGLTTSLGIGNQGGATQLNGTIRFLRIWLAAMSSAQVSAIAANDDFIGRVYAEGRTVDLTDSRWLTAANEDQYLWKANQ